MWDVKAVIAPTATVAYLFYLNYVGCKEFYWSIVFSCSWGFTLTMWDVKSYAAAAL